MRSVLARLFLAVLAAGALFLAPATGWALCAPSAKGIFPASGLVGTSVAATVTGTGLAGATSRLFGAPGFTATVQTTSDTTVTLQLQIDAAAAAGERLILLDTAGGTVAVDFTVNLAGGPIVTGVSPAAVATQGVPLALAVTGQNLAGLTETNVTVTGLGVTVADANALADGTRLDVSLTVAADAELGIHAIMIASPAGGAVLELRVQRPAPTIAQVSPGAGEVGTSVPLTITGTNLTGAALIITSGASGQGGVTVSNVVSPDDSTLTATLTISGGLAPESEPRLLIVTTESGQSTKEFFVVAAGVPSLTGTRPGAGSPSQTVPVTLRGLHLTGATMSTPSASLALQNVAVVDDETVTLEVVVSAGAVVGSDHTITATVGTASANATFRVVATGAPYISAVRPPFGNRGTTITVVLDGQNLGTIVTGTGVDLSGPKILESNAAPIDALTARAILEIDPTASVGGRNVTVTTTGGSFVKSPGFRVNVPGQVPLVTDVTPLTVAPGTTTPMTVTGSGLLGAGVTVGGRGATVTNIVVDPSGASVTFDLTLAADAPGESRPLIVVTENGTGTCNVLSLGATMDLHGAGIVKAGSVFDSPTAGFRLFLFEFSINALFEPGLRTYAVATVGPQLTLSRLDADCIGRAVRDLPFGYVRVRGVTAANQFGASDPVRFRR